MRVKTMASLASVAALLLGLGGVASLSAHNAEEAMSEVRITAALNALPAPEAGLYSVRSELLELVLPGISAEELAAAKSEVASFFPQATSQCLNAIEAANLVNEAIPLLDQEACHINQFNVRGGKFDARGYCTGDDGMRDHIAVSGTLSARGFSVVTDMLESEGGGSSVMKVKVEATRSGDCA